MLMSWDWSMLTVTSPATLSFSGSDPRSVQCLGCGVPLRLRANFIVVTLLSLSPCPTCLRPARALSTLGVVTRDFSGKRTTEPSVIGWIPSAQIYFSDPDGHTVEYITLLDEVPECEFVGSLSAWKARQKMVQPR
jgi:hypothetical protein